MKKISQIVTEIGFRAGSPVTVTSAIVKHIIHNSPGAALKRRKSFLILVGIFLVYARIFLSHFSQWNSDWSS